MLKRIYIQGMHCVSCERFLEDEFKNISGVKSVRINRQENWAEIEYEDEEPNLEKFQKIAGKSGYQVSNKDFFACPKNAKDKSGEWIRAILIMLVIFFIYRLFQKFGLADRIEVKNADLSYGLSFIVGVVASVSSCLAVVGAVVIAFSQKYKSRGKSFFQNAVLPNLFFHVGRLATFFILGGALGAIGGQLSLSGNFVSVFTIIIAIVMAIMGLNILGFFPSISNLGIRMPANMTKSWARFKNSEHKLAPFLLGGLSFFLPCGFTQSMQIFALASGSFLVGGLSLFLFALGTVPALLALGVTTSWTKKRGIAVFQKVAGMIVLLFSVYTFNSAAALLGVKMDIFRSSEKVETDNPNLSEEKKNSSVQTVEMRITRQGFSPNILKVKKGLPVNWIIQGDQVTSCTNKIIVPSLNISKNISYGENSIQFTPEKTGEIPFSCWMGMVRGKFIVE